MNCPKCRNDTFKAKVVRKQRIKELPHFIPVALQCAKDNCSHNLRVWIAREDLLFISGGITTIFKEMRAFKKEVLELLGKKEPKKKSIFDRIRR